MARAKRTDRTEARRRTRAEQAAITSEGAALATAGATTAGSTAGAKAGQPAPPVRPSITAAFRGSFRQVHFAEDLRALPRLLIHWSFWGPALATNVTTIVYIYASQGRTA